METVSAIVDEVLDGFGVYENRSEEAAKLAARIREASGEARLRRHLERIATAQHIETAVTIANMALYGLDDA
jgi:hypothetical protein